MKMRSDPMIPIPFRIVRALTETSDTRTFELKPPNGDGFIFEPGQFNMLYVRGVGEVPISISGDPDNQHTLVHTVRAVGSITNAMCELKPRDMIGVRGPYGNHWPLEEGRDHDILVVAGGIGLAPLRPVVYQLLSHREKYGQVILLYGARNPSELLYEKELRKWRGQFDCEVEITVDSAPSDWRGNVGVVTRLIPSVKFDPLHTVAMICGPEIMIRFTVMELQSRGVKAENIFVSMERNMKCGVGLCGHCQFGSLFICKDGPVFSYDKIGVMLGKREL